MSANERRAEIMRIMVARRQENMQVLASELGVSDRTIRNDIVALTAEYPLETYRGKQHESYYFSESILSSCI